MKDSPTNIRTASPVVGAIKRLIFPHAVPNDTSFSLHCPRHVAAAIRGAGGGRCLGCVPGVVTMDARVRYRPLGVGKRRIGRGGLLVGRWEREIEK